MITLITMIEMAGCPYCAKAHQAIDELKAAHPTTEIVFIDENKAPEKLKEYQGKYYYVPSLFVGTEKVFEASPGDYYEKIKAAVEKAYMEAEK